MPIVKRKLVQQVPVPPQTGDLLPAEERVSNAITGKLFDLPMSRASSQVLTFAAGVAQADNPMQYLASVVDSVKQSVSQYSVLNVQPPPSDIWAMMRLSEQFLRMNGDIWQTILVPAQILFRKHIKVGCEGKDPEARKEWERFFTDIVPINYWGQDCFFTVEQYGQWFPLEAWDGKDLDGIAALEPMSVWIGHHIGLGNFPYAMLLPADSEGFTKAKLEDMLHRSMYNTFSVNMNEQVFPAYRIEINPNALQPVFSFGKKAFDRYAIPELSRVYSDIMYRMMLKEYRQGVLEQYIQQIIMLIVKPWPGTTIPPKGAVATVQREFDRIAKNRSGALTFAWDVEARIIMPEKIDQVLATDAWMEASQTIFRGRGFDLFWASGEIAGTHGRGGGVQVEVSVQAALERWESLLTGYFEWCRYIGLKWAKLNNPALAKRPPTFSVGSIDIKTQQAIEKRIAPLVKLGKLSDHTALEESGFNYAEELANKEEEEENADLFKPSDPFGALGDGGRPDGATDQEPGTRPNRSPMHVLHAATPPTLGDAINQAFDEMLTNPTREAINAFARKVEMTLRSNMSIAYERGWSHYGGYGDLDVSFLNNTTQGVGFQIEALRKLKKDMLASVGKPEELIVFKNRATLYAGAERTAYVLGTQAAMKLHGARAWQRVLHPELSKVGPCANCTSDSAIAHPIDEPFTEFHPNGVCSAQSVMFHFADATPLEANIPTEYQPMNRIKRLPIGWKEPL